MHFSGQMQAAGCLALLMALGPHLAACVERVVLPDLDHTSTEWQVAVYSSAAPPKLASEATVMDGSMNILRSGSNGWTCMPANPQGPADPENGFSSPLEAMPICFDAEGLAWIQAFMSGTTPQMNRDAFLWMLHGDLGEDNTKPGVQMGSKAAADAELSGDWVVSGPHLMMMPKDVETLKDFPMDFAVGEPYVMWAGTPYAHVMIPVPGYYS